MGVCRRARVGAAARDDLRWMVYGNKEAAIRAGDTAGHHYPQGDPGAGGAGVSDTALITIGRLDRELATLATPEEAAELEIKAETFTQFARRERLGNAAIARGIEIAVGAARRGGQMLPGKSNKWETSISRDAKLITSLAKLRQQFGHGRIARWSLIALIPKEQYIELWVPFKIPEPEEAPTKEMFIAEGRRIAREQKHKSIPKRREEPKGSVDIIHNQDCLSGMTELEACSIHCCVTSPPYWKQRDYQVKDQIGLEKTPEEYIKNILAFCEQVYRLLRPDGTFWLNLGDGYLSKDLIGLPWRIALALKERGWHLRAEIIWHKPAPMPDGAKDRPTRAHEQIFLLTKTKDYYYDQEAVMKPTKNGDGQLRNFRATDKSHTKRGDTDRPYSPRLKANLRDVWSISHEPSKHGHAATFPSKLITPCIQAGCPAGGIVLDPFMGTGTTAVVAKKYGRHWLGYELNPKYCDIADHRLSQIPRGLPFDV